MASFRYRTLTRSPFDTVGGAGGPAASGSDTIAPGSASMPALPRLDGARILVAEDNASNRDVALDFMAAARMRVDVAFDGAEALRMVLDGDYDLVLMDIQMPEMDGLAATRAIRAVDRLHALPIVAMTAHALASDRVLSRLAGMNDHVGKPIDPDLLFCTLLKWIDPARLAGREIPPLACRAPPQGPGRVLPAVPGIDWRLALENVHGQHRRLEKRAGSFVREYGSAPRILRQALASGDHARLQSLAHDLKSSAAYIGALALAAAANRLELDLRAGLHARIAAQVPGLAAAAETVLAGLDRIAAAALPPAPEHTTPAPCIPLLLARLERHLRDDDACAENVLDQLETAPGAGMHAALQRVRRAVDEIEYDAALVCLAGLAAQLGLDSGPDPRMEDSQ